MSWQESTGENRPAVPPFPSRRELHSRIPRNHDSDLLEHKASESVSQSVQAGNTGVVPQNFGGGGQGIAPDALTGWGQTGGMESPPAVPSAVPPALVAAPVEQEAFENWNLPALDSQVAPIHLDPAANLTPSQLPKRRKLRQTGSQPVVQPATAPESASQLDFESRLGMVLNPAESGFTPEPQRGVPTDWQSKPQADFQAPEQIEGFEPGIRHTMLVKPELAETWSETEPLWHAFTEAEPKEETGVLPVRPAESFSFDSLITGEQSKAPSFGLAPTVDVETNTESDAKAVNKATKLTDAEDDTAGKPHRSLWKVLLVLLVVVALIAGAVWFAYTQLFTRNSGSDTILDYSGTGSGTVEITIEEGHLGSDIAITLYEADVIASTEAFVQACNANTLCQTVQPGSYQLAYHMSAAAALDALLDPENRLSDNAIAVNTGQTLSQIQESFVAQGFTDAEFEAAIADPDALGLPSVAGKNLEGWLASGTYQVGADDTVVTLLQEMIEAQIQILQDTGASESEWQTILIKASIVEREVAYDEYMPQVARVIENRLSDLGAETAGYLQMDSTVLYGVGKTGGVPTQADLDDDNPYNTYLYQGLPPTPIAVPSQTTIEAVVNPAEGDWLYFVTVNLETGETLFATTLAEQQQNTQLFTQYCEENSDMC